jgi:signal transduction histidine kinase
MSNVVRHAQATRLQVALERAPGELTLTVLECDANRACQPRRVLQSVPWTVVIS